MYDRAAAAINECCDNDPMFQLAIARQNEIKTAAANAEIARQSAVRSAHPDAAARVAARRAAR